MKGNQYNFFKYLVSLVLLLAFNSAVAEIFKWTDAEGRVHFTDKPPQSATTETVKLRINSFSSPSVEPFSFDETLISKRKVAQNVVMYSTTWCGYCKQARNYFQQNNIAFAEYDVEKSDKGVSVDDPAVSLGLRTMPAADVCCEDVKVTAGNKLDAKKFPAIVDRFRAPVKIS